AQGLGDGPGEARRHEQRQRQLRLLEAGPDLHQVEAQAGLGAGQPLERGAREELEGDQRRQRVPRQAEERLAPDHAQHPRPTPAGLPGRMSTPSKTMLPPSRLNTSSTRSYLPIDTPPEKTMRSAAARASSRRATRLSAESRAGRRRTGTPPARSTCAAKVWL